MALNSIVKAGLIEAVRKASQKEILPRFRALSDSDVDTKSGPDDLVTVADIRAEEAISIAARDLLPGALIVGEVAVAKDPSVLQSLPDAVTAIIIDPIDGTSNFAKGLAVFGVILAVITGGKTEFGLLYDPLLDDWVEATRGDGVWFVQQGHTRKQLSTQSPGSVRDATGYVSLHLFPDSDKARIAASFPKFSFVGNLRCSCHEYRMMELGHADFVYAASAKPWDHAAGALVLKELGGRLIGPDGDPYAPGVSRAPLIGYAFDSVERQREISHIIGVGS
ncbi:inositol monophosphatase family protein [Roseibium sp.]|uniref:inositol monophosphatase family protein n=1 Tax=Roseibium sp. TaxID=1936156 RepID=UPI003B51249D